LWPGAQPLVHVSRQVPVHSPLVDTAAISGTAVGGITALARAGYGRIITAITCGPVIKASFTVRLEVAAIRDIL
jgi:hypothetical protein